MDRLPRITYQQRKGVKKLLEWSISMYQQSTSVNGKMLWYSKKEFLAELQRQQVYSKRDKEEYNKLRLEYLRYVKKN